MDGGPDRPHPQRMRAGKPAQLLPEGCGGQTGPVQHGLHDLVGQQDMQRQIAGKTWFGPWKTG